MKPITQRLTNKRPAALQRFVPHLYSVMVVSIALLGCKPKESTLTGQVFIVTRGAESIKLGAVEVLLIEKAQVNGILQKREANVQSQIESRRSELAAAEVAAQEAKADLDVFRSTKPNPRTWQESSLYYRERSVLTNSFFKRDSACMQMRSQVEALWKEQDTLAIPLKSLEDQSTKLDARLLAGGSWADMDAREALSERIRPLQEKWERNSYNAGTIISKFEEIVNHEEEMKRQRLEAIQDRVEIAKATLKGSPTPQDYLRDFWPTPTQRTFTDADGKFVFRYSRGKSFTLFATAQRVVLDKTEKYYWLVNAPVGSKESQIFLNNNNLIFADPDGYFKVTPNAQ